VKVDPFALNSFGVQVQPIDWSDKYAPLAKTYHGLTITASDKSTIIGRITSWNPSVYTRESALQFELSYKTFGRPVDQVPGRSTAYTVAGTSAEMWDKEIEKRLAGDEALTVFNDLCDQVRPFMVYEHWFKGTTVYRTWVYRGCWLTERNEDAYTSEGDARVMANFTFQFVSRQQIV